MPTRFLVCLALPLVIWGASKLDTDLAFACFCSTFLFTAWAIVTTISEAHERTCLDIQERNHRFQKQLWEHKNPPKEWHESSTGGDYKKF